MCSWHAWASSLYGSFAGTMLWKWQCDQNTQTEQPSISTRDYHTNSCHLARTWQFRVIGTDIPEEDAKGVDVDRVVVRTSEEFRCHVDRCADNGACHHGLRLAETKVRQRTTIVAIKLWGWEVWMCDVCELTSQVTYMYMYTCTCNLLAQIPAIY